ncbi:phage tail tape measure C-terminal domain-containing protein [Bradyrhizobium sp. I71]|uniref:phage tail tape measure C-terminal domain-containing protein n=1 Tax=Bradyrhizobium sp. I71 TaxID=2590772 RepID=UPI001EF7A570|nr:phage tail tape measure C-terminal domain-containing protein [Bradyrhizobium sp. I71]ULK98840.1 hypothetical protein FJV43_03595 [Bradyrhizobium sp. I71]
MATDLERLVVSLEANISKYEKSLAKAVGQTDATAKTIEGRFKRINPSVADNFLNSFSRGLVGAAAGALALEQSIVGIRRAIGEVDDLGDMAERVGLSTDAIQALRHTLGQAGGDAELADRAFDKFSDSIAKASLGSGYLAELFKANGVALRDSSGTLRENTDLLVDFARLVTNAETPQEKLRLATEAFGRQAGPKMVGTLKEIAEQGLPALIENARAAGVVLDQGLIDKAGELDKAFRKIEERASTAYKKIAVDWGGPALLETFKGLEIAVKMFALSFDLLASGRVREAIGLIDRFEAAKQRMTVGGEGVQMTQEDAGKFYDAVGIQPERIRVDGGRKTKLPADTGGVDKADAFEREVEQTKKRIAVQEAETAAIDLGTYARERARKTVELETAAKAANKQAGLDANTVTEAQRVQIDALADAYAKAKAAAEDANGPLLSFARAARDTNAQLQGAGLSGLHSFEDALLGVITGTESAADAFKAMANSIIADLARIAIRQAITGPIAGALGGLFGGGGGGGVGTMQIGSQLFPKIGFNANGTDNWRGGPTWVGERGPEIVNLPRGAQVIPNNVARRAASGTTIQNTFMVSGDVSPGTIDKLEAAVVAAHRKVDQVNRVLVTTQRMQTTGVG